MNRFKRIAGSIVLAASLAIGGIGIAPAQAPAIAAESASNVSFSEFKTAMETIAAKIVTMVDTSTVKTSTSGSAVIAMMGTTIPLELDMDIDYANKVGHGRMPLISMDGTGMADIMAGNVSYEDLYMDLSKACMYIHDENSGIDLINDFAAESYLAGFGKGPTGGNMFTSLIDVKHLEEKKDYITITKEPVTLGGTALEKLTLKLNYPKGTFAAMMSKIMEKSGDKIPDMYAQYMNMFDPSMLADMVLNITASFYVKADYTPVRMEYACDINGIKYSGFDIGQIKVDMATSVSTSTESLVIPADRVEKALPVPGYMVQDSDIVLQSYLNSTGDDAFFSVAKVTNKKAKKIVIAASAEAFGKSYKVSKAEDKVFKGAKKLKTLVVKDAKLKKELKANRSKYGLRKKVKIK